MKLFGRELSSYAKNISRLPQYLVYFLRCFQLFENPTAVLFGYLTKTTPPSKVVKLRNGIQIFLTDHPEDILTVFLIFVREDYGQVEPDSVVIDIGANIGVFSLYAASRGARIVCAYEPNRATYEQLRRNITANNLARVITPHHLAVSSVEGATVKFPTRPSVFNRIITDQRAADFETVQTTTLPSILSHVALTDGVDLLKLDCEGAEYDIIFATDDARLATIKAIRMEYHDGRMDELSAYLSRRGFTRARVQPNTSETGDLWFARA